MIKKIKKFETNEGENNMKKRLLKARLLLIIKKINKKINEHYDNQANPRSDGAWMELYKVLKMIENEFYEELNDKE